MEISKNIRYIGVDDRDLDLFESQYIVPEGMSYNSYLILDEKTAVMDTADARCAEQWLANLKDALGERRPDYLVVHHMEPDHSSMIARMMEMYPELTVVASAAALRMLGQFFEGLDTTGRTLAVKEGDTLELGEHCLQFIAAPMVHWPEVMVSFDRSSGVLFSADAFGKFGILDGMLFSSPEYDWECEARRYYFNICGKYGVQVQALLGKVGKLEGLKTIAPLHGPVLNSELGRYVGLYDIWSRYEPETEGVLVAYASIHGGTAVVAKAIAGMLEKRGARVELKDLTREDPAECVEDAFRYSKLVLAASSYDAGVFPPMHEFLYHLQIKAYQKRRVGIIENGSWAPSAGKTMKEMLAAMKAIEIIEPTVTIRSRMKSADSTALEALAEAMLA